MNWHKHVYYDEASPSCLRWKKAGKGRLPSLVAGTMTDVGYWAFTFNKKPHLVHRVIWEMFCGPIPNGICVDHRNRESADNRIDNLRLAEHSQNHYNSKKRINTKSKYKGVSFQEGRWLARISSKGKQIYLGSYNSEYKAAMAYNRKLEEIAGEFGNANSGVLAKVNKCKANWPELLGKMSKLRRLGKAFVYKGGQK